MVKAATVEVDIRERLINHIGLLWCDARPDLGWILFDYGVEPFNTSVGPLSVVDLIIASNFNYYGIEYYFHTL